MITIGEIMHPLLTVEKKEPLSHATRIMVSHNRGSIIVTQNKKPVGILTERDILRIVSKEENTKNAKVEDFYTKKIISADENITPDEALKILDNNKIRRLPVTRKGEIVGMVTLTTITKHKRVYMAENFLSESFHPRIYAESEGRDYR